jgi:hypothetical protein
MYTILNLDAERRGVDREPPVNPLDVLGEHLDLVASRNGWDQRACRGRSHPPALLAAVHGRARLR